MEDLRSGLTLHSYNILGSWEEAKDVVQDVFLKFSELDRPDIADQKLYLSRMVVNLSIDRKRKLKKQLGHYPGPWLPEPLVTEGPDAAIHRKEILSYSMLVLLEKLDSKQRAVFILKEAFDYGHEEIARVLNTTPENSRKILSRAKHELRTDLNSLRDNKRQLKLLQKYLMVLEAGDMQQLEDLLSNEISVTSDGGGKASAFRNIIRGVKPVSFLLSKLYKKMYADVYTEIGWINHQPAIFYFMDGKVVTCQIFSIQDEQIEDLYFIRNPDKLKIFSRESSANQFS